MPTLIDRTGEMGIATCGMKMTIIAYHRSDNIDIEFEDGTVVTHKTYLLFKKGAIRHPNIPIIQYAHYSNNPNGLPLKDRTGEEKYNKQGLKLAIVAYRGANDLDVQFEDGEIVRHRTYDDFKKGRIFKPKHHIGQTNTATNGMKITLIAYRNHKDVDVEFEDGYVHYHTTFSTFMRGSVGHPETTLNAKASDRHVGETGISKHGKPMKIIRWGSKVDIDVEFDDGYVAEHRRYHNFKRGSIGHPDDDKVSKFDKTGDVSTSTKGQKMTIETYRSSKDVDIRFEDGTLVTHKKYLDFRRGLIYNPNYTKAKYEGRTTISRDGIKVTVINRSSDGSTVTLRYETGYVTTRDCRANIFDGYKMKHPYPYNIGGVIMEGPAYIHKDIGNFYCRCSKCHLSDIMTVQEAKDHVCQNS